MQPATNPKKEHIDRLHNERVNNPLWCTDQANVGIFAEGLLSGGRFFNELVQNADDAEAKEMDFEFTAKELVLSHSGRHFTENDVEKIIRFAQQELRDKTESGNATGYKGIGFKALASIASKIYIFSQDYKFRFDREFWGARKIPWQMVPIWTEFGEVPAHLQPILKPLITKVIFVFQLLKPLEVKADLNQTVEQTKALLFLRNVKVVNVTSDKTKTVLKREDVGEVRRLTRHDFVSEWTLKKVNIPIPDDIREHLQTLNATVCPDRLKRAKSVELQFAFRLEKSLSNKTLEIFSTLPTHVNFKLPFAINAEFLLQAQREHLENIRWNHFLIERVAQVHFQCLQEIAKSVLWIYVLRGLGPASIENKERKIVEAYAKGYASGSTHYPFIPSQRDPKTLLPLDRSILDRTKFFHHFQKALPPDLIPSNIVYAELASLEKLEQIPCVEQFDIHKLSDELEKIFKTKQDAKFCYEVLCFLFKRFYSEWRLFVEKAFIPTKQGKVGCLAQLSLPPAGNCPLPPDFIQVDLIHDEILALDTTGDIRRWLIHMGVEILTPRRIVQKFIADYVQTKVTEKTSYPLVRYLFQLYHEGHIRPEDLLPLRTMPVLTRANQLQPVEQLFLYSAYNPVHALENILVDQLNHFITSKYMEKNEMAFYWNNFFIALGAKAECTLEIRNEVTVEALRQQNVSFLTEFLTHLYSNPNRVIGRPVRPSDIYKNFIFFPLLENLKNKEFLEHFWQTVQKFGKQIIAIDKTCVFASATQKMASLADLEKLSYLKFVLRTKKLIRGTDGKLHNAQDLFSPSLRLLVGGGLVAASASVDLPEELAGYLGFKTQIPVKLCFVQMNKMRESAEINLPFYTLLLRNILKSCQLLSDKERQEQVASPWLFVAENNSWQPVAHLKCFAIEGPLPILHSTKWFKNVLSTEEMIELAKIFNRPVVTEAAKEGLIKNPIPSTKFKSLLMDRLPLFAYILAYLLGEKKEETLKKLALQLDGLEIYQAEEIPPLDEGEKKQNYVCLGKKFYHEGSWKKNKIKLIECVGHFLKLERAQFSDFVTVMTLKKHETEAWIEEQGIDPEEISNLEVLLSELEKTPHVLQQTPSLTLSPQGAAPTPDDGKTNAAKDHRKGNPIPFPDLAAAAVTEEIGTKLENLTLGEKGGEISWTPQVGTREMAVVTIAKGVFVASPPKETKEKTGGSKAGKGSVSRLSDKDKGQIGRWGEEFVIKNLLAYYTEKHHVTFCEAAPGTYHWENTEIKLDLHWLNHTSESNTSYDLTLKKERLGKVKPEKKFVHRHIEVKATKGSKIHFFLSENEYAVMESDPKYRLYHVLKAGKTSARMLKFAHLLDDIKSNKAVPILHKSYEFKSK